MDRESALAKAGIAWAAEFWVVGFPSVICSAIAGSLQLVDNKPFDGNFFAHFLPIAGLAALSLTMASMNARRIRDLDNPTIPVERAFPSVSVLAKRAYRRIKRT